MKDVQVDGTTSGMPIRLAGTYRCVVRDSHVHNSYSYGFGQDNYGIVLACGAADNLVENNIARFMNKPILFNNSGGGNVVGYNYADNSWSCDGNNDDGFQEVNIDCHCAFPHMELMEGNWAPHMGATTTHGNAGYLTYFRNYASSQWSPSIAGQPTSAIVWSQPFAPQYANVGALEFDATDLKMTVIGNVLGQHREREPRPAARSRDDEHRPRRPRRSYTADGGSPAIFLVDKANVAWTSLWLTGNFDTVNKKVMWNASALTANLPASHADAARVALLRDEARLVAERDAVAVGRARSLAARSLLSPRTRARARSLHERRRRELHARLRQLLLQRRPELLALKAMPLPDDSGSLVTEPKPHVIAGRYEVRGLVGVGGMGAVYKVYDRALDEVVALKMLRPELSHSAEMLERFRREVKLARRVTHPNVARTFDIGERERRALPHDGARRRRVARDDARAERAARSRDGGRADRTAFARASRPRTPPASCTATSSPTTCSSARTDASSSRTSASRGSRRSRRWTPRCPWERPRTWRPSRSKVATSISARTSMQLGVMLFELLTSRLPFEASTPYAVAAMRLVHPPPDPRVHVATLPESVALLVRRCMARNPEDRPASALEVATRFAGLTLPQGSIAPPSKPPAFVVSMKAHTKSVGVVPFRNASAPEDEYLVDGLTDDLVDALSMTPGLRVRARGAIMQLQGGPAARDPRELGRALAVQVVVHGTVRSDGDRIRVSARALSVDDGFQLWAQRFEGSRSDVLRIADEAAFAIATALTVEKPTRPIVTNPQAVDLYLRGRHEFLKYWTAANDRAIKLLAEANTIAPDDPVIMSAYAAALTRQFGVAEVEGRFEHARDVARRAVELAPEMADAHVALAATLLHAADAVGAAREITKALYDIAPSHPDAMELKSRMLAEAGALRTSIEFARRCIQLEPRMSALRYNVIARSHALLGEWDEVDLDLATPPVDLELASVYWLMRTRLALWRRDVDGAARIAAAVRAQPPFGARGIVLSACVFMTAKMLATQEVEFIDARASAPHMTPRMRCFWHQVGGEIFSFFGDASRALEHLEQAETLGLFDAAWLERCPLFDLLRDHPRFETLRARISARASAVADALDARGRP